MSSISGLTWREILDLLNGNLFQTHYEKERGIRARGYSFAFENTNIKIAIVEKTDNSRSIYILARAGLKSDFWLFWAVTDEQAQALKWQFPRIYDHIQALNKALKG